MNPGSVARLPALAIRDARGRSGTGAHQSMSSRNGTPRVGLFVVHSQQIVPGITLDAAHEVTVDATLTDVLCDLAIELQDDTGLPVDVEHVIAAAALAVKQGDWSSDEPLNTGNARLRAVLQPHVRRLLATDPHST